MIDAILRLEAQAQRAAIGTLIVLLGVAVAVGAVGILYYRGEAAAAREEATRCAGDLAVEKANVGALEAAIGSQNLAVGALKDEADKRVAESREAVERARKEAERHLRAADGILAAKPADPSDMCASALQLYEATVAGRIRP